MGKMEYIADSIWETDRFNIIIITISDSVELLKSEDTYTVFVSTKEPFQI